MRPAVRRVRIGACRRDPDRPARATRRHSVHLRPASPSTWSTAQRCSQPNVRTATLSGAPAPLRRDPRRPVHGPAGHRAAAAHRRRARVPVRAEYRAHLTMHITGRQALLRRELVQRVTTVPAADAPQRSPIRGHALRFARCCRAHPGAAADHDYWPAWPVAARPANSIGHHRSRPTAPDPAPAVSDRPAGFPAYRRPPDCAPRLHSTTCNKHQTRCDPHDRRAARPRRAKCAPFPGASCP